MSVDVSYALTPFVAWLVAGVLKFSINSLRARKPAFGLIGYGGFPSNHTSIVCSMAALVAFKEGINQPMFGVAVALAFIVMLDASSLRRQVGKHASAINQLSGERRLRERMGHTPLEIAGGVITGVAVAGCVQLAGAYF
jgi:acid phosphatase family membrane protein YuiD